jgi:hypothetical protein
VFGPASVIEQKGELTFTFQWNFLIQCFHSFQDFDQAGATNPFSGTIPGTKCVDPDCTLVIETLMVMHQPQAKIVSRQGFHFRHNGQLIMAVAPLLFQNYPDVTSFHQAIQLKVYRS